MNIDLNKYTQFVQAITSKESNDLTTFINRLDDLDANYDDDTDGPAVNLPLLLTAAMGLGSESGEFQEIVKKLLFQGKPLTTEVHYHMIRELGDVIWYWINACRALQIDPNEVIAENISKLESRYPGGSFNAYFSENRASNDI